jgi:choice-of-anchor B domain-containing protein
MRDAGCEMRDRELIMRHWKLFLFLAIFCGFHLFLEAGGAQPCVSGKSADFGCKAVMLQTNIPLANFRSFPASASNLWGYVDPDDQHEYALIGLSNGTAVVDVTNAIKPRVVGIVRGKPSLWREVKVYSVFNGRTKKWDAYAYISTEAQDGGLQVIDLSQLPRRVSLAFTDHEISTSHTLFVANVDFVSGKPLPNLTPILYVHGSNEAGLVAYSLKNPKNPRIIGRYTETYVHDMYAETFTGQRARQCASGHDPCEVVFASTGRDLRTIDFTDKSNPIVLDRLEYEGLGYAHSSWISQNKNWLFNFDEFDEIDSSSNTRIRTINIQDFRNLRVAATFRGTEKSIEHNGYVVGNKLYISHYTRGLVIMDVTNPTNIRELGYFDTWPEDDKKGGAPRPQHPGHGSASFNGAWGVYPFLPSGNILISDIERGLFVLREQ